MKNFFGAQLALVFAALALSGCFFPGGYDHNHDRYGGGYSRPVGPPPGPGPYVGGGYHKGP